MDWNDVDAPEKAKTAALEGQVAIEAHYFDAEAGRTWLIEMINGSPAPGEELKGAGGGKLTPEIARGLIMALLNSLKSITGPKSS